MCFHNPSHTQSRLIPTLLFQTVMPPFSKANQPIRDPEAGAGASPIATLPGHPSIIVNDIAYMRRFLEKGFYSRDLEIMAPRLWMMTTLSSTNINPLHRQRVKSREIIVTEEPRLHLVWIHDRIFNETSDRLGDSQRNIRKAATGFLRTYYYLIQHKSDFNVAQQDNLRLIPKDIDWPSFYRLVSEFNHIEDSAVSSDRNGPVWYGMEVKPYYTSCLCNNRYGLTGKTSNTAKTAKNEVEIIEGRKEMYNCTTRYQLYPRYCYYL
ncbi:hypothetical protein GQ44DRAFT_720446 [Phaeosphaeriaceae sp. PMI808]|nr:hypothetical protein GQ44DRAFT_720446 [Phaeosphaeriaceae sp. PMI808]